MVRQTKYSIIKEKIMEWIINGDVKPGEKIYSEFELVKMLGVSRQTVRQAIGDLVNEGWLYRKHGSGTFCSDQGLKNQNTESLPANNKSIGVITTYISDYIFPSIIKGIESYLTPKGYSLIFACTDNNIEKEKQCLQSMLNSGIDGLIVEPTKSSNYNPNVNDYLKLEQRSIPYVMINQFYTQLAPPHIIVNDEKGGYLATDHLIKLGHKNIIGFFKTDDLQGVYRMQGFIRAFRDNNLSVFPGMIISYTTENMGINLLESLKGVYQSSESKPTGIFCYNDQIAITVINSLRHLGVKVPEEVSIVGYDDSYLAEALNLTSVTHPKTQMGIDAAKWIVSVLENREINHSVPPFSMVYEPELVIRDSSLNKKIMTAES